MADIAILSNLDEIPGRPTPAPVSLLNCATCKAEGATIRCSSCELNYHPDCCSVDANSTPAYDWVCVSCNINRHLHADKRINQIAMKQAFGLIKVKGPSKVAPAPIVCVGGDQADDNMDFCARCHDVGELLCCDFCDRSFHLTCCIPVLKELPEPDSDWMCHVCKKAERSVLNRVEDSLDRPQQRKPTGINMSALTPNRVTRSGKAYNGGLANGSSLSVPTVACDKCNDPNPTVQCSRCPSAFHLNCCSPPLDAPPKPGWLCESCALLESVADVTDAPAAPKLVRQRPRPEFRPQAVVTADPVPLVVDETAATLPRAEADAAAARRARNAATKATAVSQRAALKAKKTVKKLEKKRTKKQKQAAVPVAPPPVVAKPPAKSRTKKSKAAPPVAAEANVVWVDPKDDNSHAHICMACNETGLLICCDGCPLSYHLHCCVPKLTAVPRGKWYCNRCRAAAKYRSHLKKQERLEKAAAAEPVKPKPATPAKILQSPPSANRKSIYLEASDDSEGEPAHTINAPVAVMHQVMTNINLPPLESTLVANDELTCAVCQQIGAQLECTNCPYAFHATCMTSPPTSIPEGGWYCPECVSEGSGPQPASEDAVVPNSVISKKKPVKRRKTAAAAAAAPAKPQVAPVRSGGKRKCASVYARGVTESTHASAASDQVPSKKPKKNRRKLISLVDDDDGAGAGVMDDYVPNGAMEDLLPQVKPKPRRSAPVPKRYADDEPVNELGSDGLPKSKRQQKRKAATLEAAPNAAELGAFLAPAAIPTPKSKRKQPLPKLNPDGSVNFRSPKARKPTTVMQVVMEPMFTTIQCTHCQTTFDLEEPTSELPPEWYCEQCVELKQLADFGELFEPLALPDALTDAGSGSGRRTQGKKPAAPSLTSPTTGDGAGPADDQDDDDSAANANQDAMEASVADDIDVEVLKCFVCDTARPVVHPCDSCQHAYHYECCPREGERELWCPGCNYQYKSLPRHKGDRYSMCEHCSHDDRVIRWYCWICQTDMHADRIVTHVQSPKHLQKAPAAVLEGQKALGKKVDSQTMISYYHEQQAANRAQVTEHDAQKGLQCPSCGASVPRPKSSYRGPEPKVRLVEAPRKRRKIKTVREQMEEHALFLQQQQQQQRDQVATAEPDTADVPRPTVSVTVATTSTSASSAPPVALVAAAALTTTSAPSAASS